MYFKDIPGHHEVKADIINMRQNGRLPHTMLFYGRQGTALLAMARALGQYIMCGNSGEADSCGKCSNCRKIDKHQHADFHFAFPLISVKEEVFDRQMTEFQQSFRIFLNTHPFGSVPEWLEILKAEKKQINISKAIIMSVIKRLSLKSYETGAIVMIIWLPEYMANEGNRLLKLLEEPPNGSYIILVSEEPERILSTILSRAQQLRLAPYQDAEIYNYLQSVGIKDTSASQATFLANGDLQKAISVAHSNEDDSSELWLEIVRTALKNDKKAIVELSLKLGDKTREDMKLLMDFGLDFIGECLSARYKGDNYIRLSGNARKAAMHLGKIIQQDSLEVFSIQTNDARRGIESNPNMKLLMLDYINSLSYIFKNNLSALEYGATQHK